MRIRTLLMCSLTVGLGAAASAQEVRPTGLIFLDEGQYQSIPYAATPLRGEIPSNVDLSQWFPAPGDQGQQASCVGWAVAYALKSYQEHREREWSLDTDDHLFSPAYIYNQIKSGGGCDTGTHYTEAMNLLRREGCSTLDNFPYDAGSCSVLPSAAVKQQARDYSVADWRRVNVQDDGEVKAQIASGFPVLIGMIVDDKFMRLRGSSPYKEPTANKLGGHAMVAVGYDDDKKAYKVINSWGERWGDDGYGWIDYYAFRSTVREAYVIQDIVLTPPVNPGPAPAPQPNPGPAPTPPAPQPQVPLNATLEIPTVLHNTYVTSNTGTFPGMTITVPGRIQGGKGKTVQIAIKFSYVDGRPLFAHPLETIYRDVGGLVATGTPARAVGTDDESFGSEKITIPYYALNFPPTNGMASYQLLLVAVLYVDNQPLAQSQPVPFALRF